MFQEEHTPDWYFHSAGLAMLWNGDGIEMINNNTLLYI